MILIIDNYDSFTWNLVHYLRELGASVEVIRNDEMTAAAAIESTAAGFLISPGPGRPEDAGLSLDLVGLCVKQQVRPLLGVCLGQQVIAQHFGARIAPAPRLMHGKTCPVEHDGTGVFAGLPSPFIAARYHSLAVVPDGLPFCLAVNATAADATIQGLRHRDLPIHGVQFHPESVASEHGHRLLSNFLAMTASAADPRRPAPA